MGSLRYAGSGSEWPFSAVIKASFQDCRDVLMHEGMVRAVDDRAAGGRGQPASGIMGSVGCVDLRCRVGQVSGRVCDRCVGGISTERGSITLGQWGF
jgi:hypothetical protein